MEQGMKKFIRTIIAILLICCFTGACSCADRNDAPSETSPTGDTSTSVASETSGSTVTPIPTYAPGTELYGMLSVNGEVIVEPKYEYLDIFSEEGLARFCNHGWWGYLNIQSEEIISAQYEDAGNFSEGLAAVKVDGLWGFINSKGEMVIEPQFEEVEYGFRYGRCVITLGNLKGLIDTEGIIILEPQYATIEFSCQEYFIVMDGEDRYGVIDRDGNIVLNMQESVIEYVDANGYIFFSIDKGYDECVAFKKMTDTSGKVEYSVQEQDVFFCKYYNYSSYLCAKEKEDDYWGVYDLKIGQFVTDRIYQDITFEGETSEFAFTEKDQCFGVLDSASGKPILERKYQWVAYSSDGQFAAFTDKQNCIVFDYSGKFVFETDKGILLFEYLDQFNCWRFTYNKDKYGLINMQGEIVITIGIAFSWLHDRIQDGENTDLTIGYSPTNAVTPYIQEEEDIYSFIGNDFSLVKRGPYVELIGYTRQSGIIIGIDEDQHCEVLDVRGTVLFSSEKPIEFVTGNAEYFVYRQAID